MERLELYYQIASHIYDICTTLSGTFCFMVWIRPFMMDRRKVRYAGGVYFVGMLAGALVPFYVNVMLMYGVVMLAVFLVMGRMERSYATQKLFLVITFFCVRWQAWRVVGCIGNELYLLKTTLIRSADGMFWFRIYVIQSALDMVLGSFLMYGAVKCLLWAYGNRREHMNIREFLLLVMPSVSGVLAYGLFRYFNYVYERDSGRSTFDIYGGYDYIILLYTLICFATIFVMTYVFRQWKNEQEEDKQKEVFSRQMKDMQGHIKEVERLYRDMRSLRHDMGNHLMTLEQLYGAGAYEQAEQYVGTLKQEIQNISSDVASGNLVTDIIISGRKKEMEDKGIRFDCDFYYPQTGGINAFDVSIILNNALSNAVEAVERERMIAIDQDTAQRSISHISLVSHRAKNMYIIEVSNPYKGELTINAASGLPDTSKTGDGHGFGLANIRQAARKYYGDMEINKEMREGEEYCVLRVMLQLM